MHPKFNLSGRKSAITYFKIDDLILNVARETPNYAVGDEQFQDLVDSLVKPKIALKIDIKLI